MRTDTTFRFLPGTAGHRAHGDAVLTAYKIIRNLADGGVLVNLAEGSMSTRPVRPAEVEIITEPAPAYFCEHCKCTHYAARNILVTVTNCPGTVDGGAECEHEACEEIDAMCFEDADDAMAYALAASSENPNGAAEIFSVYTDAPERDVTERWATVVDGAVLGD